MKLNHLTTSDHTTHTFLTGAIVFASMDYSSLAIYALKAVIGGAIWMAFKVAGDYFSDRVANRKKKKEDHSDKTEND